MGDLPIVEVVFDREIPHSNIFAAPDGMEMAAIQRRSAARTTAVIQHSSKGYILMKSLISYLTHSPRKWSTYVPAILVALAMGVCCSSAVAQSGAGSIQGTVTDSSGAIIPGAAIHVVQQATNVATDTKSTNIGFYQVPDLFTGTYVVTVTAPGFNTYTTRIELLVSQNAVINPVMTIGAETQQVTVSANAVQLTNTENGTIGSTLENARINQLPMNGRSLTALTAETTPGLGSCTEEPAGNCPNGMQGSALEYFADGVTTTGREFGGDEQGQVQMPDLDAIQEVRMETSGVGAEYATPAVGIITTKSGTNSVHGTMFETARNNAWGIAKERQNPSNYAAPPYIRNEFGASAGGPIVLPHVYHGKDKSFWFFAYERYSLASISDQNVTTPEPAWEQGNFSGLTSSAGLLQLVYDPATTTANAACPTPGVVNGVEVWNGGTPTNNPYCRMSFIQEYGETGSNVNTIPSNRLSPTAKILFDISPPPTSTANPLVTTNLSAVDASETRIPTETFRLDHVFNENNRAYLRYTDDLQAEHRLRDKPSDQPTNIAADGIPAGMSGVYSLPDDMFNFALGYTHVFSPTFFAETILSNQWMSEWTTAPGSSSSDYESQLGTPNNFGEPGFPDFVGISLPFDGTQWQYGMNQIISDVDENLTKTVGKHQLQFGGRYRHERFGLEPNQSTDDVEFGSYATALLNPATISGDSYAATSNTGNANPDMFLGAAYYYSVNEKTAYQHMHDMEFDGYFQDNYHVSRSLTLNLGLRYEAHPGPWEKYGEVLGFDLKNDAMVTALPLSTLISEGLTTQAIITNDENDGVKFETAQEAGFPANTLIRNHDLTVGPRVGFAYQPFGGKYGTVIRGAFGRYIYPIELFTTKLSYNIGNPFTASYNTNYTTAAQAPDDLPNYIMRAAQTTTGALSAGTPVMGVNSSGVVNSTSTTAILPGLTEYTMDPDISPTFASQTNFTIEQPLKGNSVLRLSWLWTHGSDLYQEFEYNAHPSTYAWEMETGVTPPNGGTSAIGTNQYSATATGPYNQTTWSGSSAQDQSSGWSNFNALQAVYQRMFHNGIAYQIDYMWAKQVASENGSENTESFIYPSAGFVGNTQGATNTYMTPAYGPVIVPTLPPPPPAGEPSWAYSHALNHFENYAADTEVPKQHIQFNGIVDLPLGRGKRFLGNANRTLNELVGGWQIAGDGNIVSQQFAITATNWGPTNPLHVYKHKAPITDCRSGVCHKEFEWFNGYIAPTSNANVDCTTNCVSGLPSNWAPYQVPIDNTPGTTYYGDNEVNITLANGKTSAIAYAPAPATSTATGLVGSNPYAKTVLNGPMNWSADASLFKVLPITERVSLRFNMDAFNVFNVQGYENPNGTDGTEAVVPGVGVADSYNTARQVQFTLRLTF
jgi:hypothetical protein